MVEREELLLRARQVRRHAHAPYSKFPVGAALLAADGSVHVGCNVENASYGLTVCAERSALAAAVAAGRRRFRALALSTESEDPVPPCGACRQALAEFAPGLSVVSEAGDSIRRWQLEDLLPEPFRGVRPGKTEPGVDEGVDEEDDEGSSGTVGTGPEDPATSEGHDR